MTVSKTPIGRWRAFVKSGRDTVATKTFDLKRDAQAWHDAEKRKLAMGEYVDPKAGKLSLGDAARRWLNDREGTVAKSTFIADQECLRRLPKHLANRPLNSLQVSDFEAFYGALLKINARGTVSRTRDTLSALFTWSIRQGMISKHIIRESKVPRGTGTDESHEPYPFTAAELYGVVEDVRAMCDDKDAADILLTLGLTGLRWGELCALRVRDVQELPYFAFRISRSKSDGKPLRTVTKGGKVRVVPLHRDVIAVIEPRLTGEPEALLFPNELGTFRMLSNFKRASHWNRFGRSHRIHDLRHTAATLWLSNMIDPKTVQAWLGHATATQTMDTYVHWIGTDADAASIAKLNAAVGYAGGTPVTKLRAEK